MCAYSLRTLSLPVYLCLWNLRGGGESTTLRDYDLICILWSCVLVVTVDNWSMPLIPALCLSTSETPFHEIFVNSQTEVRGPFRSFEADMMIPLKLSFLRSWILSLAKKILTIWVHMLSCMHKHPKKWAHTQTWQRQGKNQHSLHSTAQCATWWSNTISRSMSHFAQ